MDRVQWSEIKRLPAAECQSKQFWKAVQIWNEKPHVVNKRLSVAVQLASGLFSYDKINTLLKKLTDDFKSLDKLDQIQNYLVTSLPFEKNLSSDGEIKNLVKICVRKLIPKSSGKFGVNVVDCTIIELVLLDVANGTATFIPLGDVNFTSCAYQFTLQEEAKTSTIALSLPTDYLEPSSPSSAVTRPTISWLSDTLLPKLAKWSVDVDPDTPLSSSHALISGERYSNLYAELKQKYGPKFVKVRVTQYYLLKLAKWAVDVDPDTPLSSSHALISGERYSNLYAELKQKYGPKFVKIWPENTDPQKFVYEDIAIATYILSLWEQEREEKGLERKQSFVDLGCGNGFLVHILNSEGFSGKGIDLRSRHIWSLYGPETNLEECSIIPSDKHLFPESDWLIGNHSDELTPWIPVMAARSSPSTQYFVLPCCFHDFAGKFVRSNSKQTQYRAYLDFVREVGDVCGFDVDEDIMRIPSTKRICQIGRRSTKQSQEEQTNLDEAIKKYITTRCPQKLLTKPISNFSHNSLSSKTRSPSSALSASGDNCHDNAADKDAQMEVASNKESLQEVTPSHIARTSDSASNSPATDLHQGQWAEGFQPKDKVDSNQGQWAEGFQPRDKVEAVRNCSRLTWDLKVKITNDIAFALLRKGGVKLDEDAVDHEKVKGQKLWRRGGKLSIPEIAGLFDKDTLKQLKNECGGLKTVLKNANQVFEISGSSVQLKDWSVKVERTENRRATKKHKGQTTNKKPIKSRQCWFYTHHPDGCPRLQEDCSFAHGLDDVTKQAWQ